MADTSNTALEVEQKFFFEDTGRLKEVLAAEGFTFVGKTEETDVYFSDAEGDYVRDRTCLRFRTTPEGGFVSIDYKGKSEGLTGGFAKRESNFVLPATSAEAVEELLSLLGFYRYTDVVKTREVYRRAGEGYVENAVIDVIEDVGRFLEMEVLAPPSGLAVEDLKKILATRVRSLSKCDIRAADVPYRDFAAWVYRRTLGDAAFDFLIVDLDSLFDLGSNEATGDALFAASIRALRKIAARYGLLLLSQKPREGVTAWLKRSGIAEENYILIGPGDPVDRLLEGKNALGLLSPQGSTAWFKEKGLPYLSIGPAPFHHLMQVYLLLSCAQPCEVL